MSPAQPADQGDEWLTAQLNRVERHLLAELGEGVPASMITESVRRAHERFAQAPVRPFLPTLIERDVRRRIRDHDDGSFQNAAS